MFGKKARKRAVRQLQESINRHSNVRIEVEETCIELFEIRNDISTGTIYDVEDLINSIKNTPISFQKTITEVKINMQHFQHVLTQFQDASSKADLKAAKQTGGGVLTGVGVAAYGPTGLMAFATTFGTASTGTAISTLSGAAATNAALAWLGMGTVASGGAGMAGGGALLVATGPIGWAIGGTALLIGGSQYKKKNKRIAREATEKNADIMTEIYAMKASQEKIVGLISTTTKHKEGIESLIKHLKSGIPQNYRRCTKAQKEALISIINHTRALGMLIQQQI